MQTPKEKLLVRYLVVPLITSRLIFRDCPSIINKMQAKIRGWVVKHFNYGGRLQLVKSMLNSIHIYWSGLFIPPKKLIKKFEGLMASFLWSGEIKPKYQAKVMWTNICSEVREGGMWILNLEICNKIWDNSKNFP